MSSEAATHRLRGEFDEAKRDYAESQRLYREIDASRNVAWIDVFLGWIAWIEDDQTAAERRFRDALRTLTQLGASSYVCEAQRALAELLLARGRLEEAERLAQSAKDTVSQHDISSLGTVTTTLALVRAAQRRDEEAETLLRQALAVYDGTDFRVLRFEPQTALAEFLLERGRDDEASELLVDLPDPVPGWLGRADARSVALLAQARSA
jgi:tetratricopeptide (TPR) repeat protein